MANGNVGGTPLGYGAAVLGESQIDPIGLGFKVLEREDRLRKERKAQEEKDIELAKNTFDPQLTQVKWAAAYINEFENRINDYTRRNVDQYNQQGGLITGKQQIQNAIELREIESDAKLVNAYHNRYLEYKNLVEKDPNYNTPENREALLRWSDPYKTNKAEIDKAGGIVNWLAENPMEDDFKPKEQALDVISRMEKIKTDLLQQDPTAKPEFDETTGAWRFPDVKKFDLVKARARAGIMYENDPELKRNYPNVEDWQTAVNQYFTEKVVGKDTYKFPKTATKTKAQIEEEKKGQVKNIGGFDIRGDVQATQTNQYISAIPTTGEAGEAGEQRPEKRSLSDIYFAFQEGTLTYNDFLSRNKKQVKVDDKLNQTIKQFGGKNYRVLTDLVNMPGIHYSKNDKPIVTNTTVSEVGELQDGKIVWRPINAPTQVSSSNIQLSFQANQDIPVKTLPTAALQKYARQIGIVNKDGNIPANTVFTEGMLKRLDEANATNFIKPELLVLGEGKNLQPTDEGTGKKYLPQQFFKFKDLEPGLELQGITLNQNREAQQTTQQDQQSTLQRKDPRSIKLSDGVTATIDQQESQKRGKTIYKDPKTNKLYEKTANNKVKPI